MNETTSPHGAYITLSLVEYVDRELEHRRKFVDTQYQALREILSLNLTYMKQANELAYIELQRRLDVLNHAHQEAKLKEQAFLPRENFDQFFKDFGKWRDEVNGFQSNLIGKISVSVGLVGVVLFLLSHFWK